MKSAIIILLTITVISVHAQVSKRVAERAKNTAENTVGEKIDKGIDNILNGSIFKKKKKQDADPQTEANKSSENKTAVITSNAGTSVTGNIKTYSKFDFVSGEKVIALEDFSNTSVGDFPLGWNTNSSAEVVTIGDSPAKWLFMTKDGFFQPTFIKDMPENFTLEFDVLTRYRSSNILEYQFQLSSSVNPKRDLSEEYTSDYFLLKWLACDMSTTFYVAEKGEIVNKNEGFSVKDFVCGDEEHLTPVKVRFSVWRQKNRLRIYANENKIVDIPEAFDTKLKYNVFKFGGKYINFATSEHKDEFMVSNIRYAIGAADTRNKLITEGKLVTRGILFDTNSDQIKLSSYGVLKDIASVLAENPSVKIKIIGHTDSDGETQTNLILSQKRAIAVKNMLAGEFKIDQSRMLTDGKGEVEPSDLNTTAAGKANNRRVEFIKL